MSDKAPSVLFLGGDCDLIIFGRPLLLCRKDVQLETLLTREIYSGLIRDTAVCSRVCFVGGSFPFR